MNRLTPEQIREAVKASGFLPEFDPVTSDPRDDPWIAERAALAYADVLERGLVLVRDDNGQWPLWAQLKAADFLDSPRRVLAARQLFDALEAAQREATPQKCHCLAPSSCEHAQREMG